MKNFWIFPALMFSLTVNAQSYPSKPVKLVVPFPAGSATDQIARVIGNELQGALDRYIQSSNKLSARRKERDSRTADEILGYDDSGLPR